MPTFQKLVFVLLFLPSAGVVARSRPAPDDAWQKEYDECQAYGDVYVVKKIISACRSYQSFLTDQNGRKLTPAFRDIGAFEEGLAEFVPMERDRRGRGLHGFIDRQGRIVIEPRYVSTDRFRNGKTWVIYPVGKQYGLSYIDRTGKEVYRIPIQYFPHDYLIKEATLKYTCNHDTQEDVLWWRGSDLFILNFNFTPFVEGQIQESKLITPFIYSGKFGVIDRELTLKVPVALDAIDVDYTYSGQGLERVQYGDRYSYINPSTGELIAPFLYTDTRRPTKGLFWVKRGGKWGCIDRTGRLCIPHVYDEATGFTAEDRSAVAINGRFGHIDKSGKVRTPLQYDFASYYNHGISMVRIDDKYGYIDTAGRFVTPLIYDEALPFDNPTTIVERWGLRFELSLNGKEQFMGFNYKLKALFIVLGTVLFIGFSNWAIGVRSRFQAPKP